MRASHGRWLPCVIILIIAHAHFSPSDWLIFLGGRPDLRDVLHRYTGTPFSSAQRILYGLYRRVQCLTDRPNQFLRSFGQRNRLYDRLPA